MRPPLARIAAVPGGDDAARALDDGHEGQDVERLEPSFDHEVDLACREQAIIVAIAAEAPQPHASAQRRETPPLLLGGEQVGAGRGEKCLAQSGAGPGAEAPLASVVPEKGLVGAGVEALAGEGLVHQAEQRAAVGQEPDQRAP